MLKTVEYADNCDDAILMSVVSARKNPGLEFSTHQATNGRERKSPETILSKSMIFFEVLGTIIVRISWILKMDGPDVLKSSSGDRSFFLDKIMIVRERRGGRTRFPCWHHHQGCISDKESQHARNHVKEYKPKRTNIRCAAGAEKTYFGHENSDFF